MSTHLEALASQVLPRSCEPARYTQTQETSGCLSHLSSPAKMGQAIEASSSLSVAPARATVILYTSDWREGGRGTYHENIKKKMCLCSLA